MEADIEKLRAALIVDAAVLQSLIECLPQTLRLAVCADVVSKMEQFSVRTLNSTMPEAFASAQQERANAWTATLTRIAAF